MERPEPVRFYFDYVDPASFLLDHRIREERMSAAAVVLEGYEIRPPPLPLLDPVAGPWRERWEALGPEGRAMGFEMEEPRIVPWTRKAHELARFARSQDRFQAVHEALFRAFFLEGSDIGRIDVLTHLAGSLGLDPAEASTALGVDRYRADIVDTRERARQEGVIRIPTLLWRDRMLEGYPDRETLNGFLDSIHDH